MVGVSGCSVAGSVLDVTEAAIRDGSFEHNRLLYAVVTGLVFFLQSRQDLRLSSCASGQHLLEVLVFDLKTKQPLSPSTVMSRTAFSQRFEVASLILRF